MPSFPLSRVGGRPIRGTTSSLPSSLVRRPRVACSLLTVGCSLLARRWLVWRWTLTSWIRTRFRDYYHHGRSFILTLCAYALSRRFKLISRLYVTFSSLLNLLEFSLCCFREYRKTWVASESVSSKPLKVPLHGYTLNLTGKCWRKKGICLRPGLLLTVSICQECDGIEIVTGLRLACLVMLDSGQS